MKIERVDIAGVTLAHVDTGGGGPAVLFVHGLGGSLYGWWAQIAACREAGYRAIAYDQRGAGLSSRPPGPYSVEQWADEGLRLLDALEVERAALVGHSVGCMVAEQAALRLGERAWALALCAGARAWPEQALPTFRQRAELARAGRLDEIAAAVATTGLTEAARRDNPALHGLMMGLIAANDPEGYALSALATGEGRMLELEALRCPTLAFAGSEDPVTPPEAAREIAAAVPRGEHAVVEGTAHWCMLERPGAVSEVLLGFLGRNRPG